MKASQSYAPKENFIPRSDRPDLMLRQQSCFKELQVRDLDVILGKKFANENRLEELNDKSATPAILDKGIEKTHRDGCDFLSSWSSGREELRRYFETMVPTPAHFPAADADASAEIEPVVNNCDK